MALQPIDEKHALQIQAGTLGRHTGHDFEGRIAAEINSLAYPCVTLPPNAHVQRGDPALLLLNYISSAEGIATVIKATAISTGALATSEAGKQWLSINGSTVSRCKSDLVITVDSSDGRSVTVGVSTKQCGNAKPTNAQLYFTTACGFANLLNKNGFAVSAIAIAGLRRFCGDIDFRPSDLEDCTARAVDPRRYFWEEIPRDARTAWETLFSDRQDDITRLLLQKAYLTFMQRGRSTPDHERHCEGVESPKG
jgi:hypothetical protein